jgi:hypothetical protein
LAGGANEVHYGERGRDRLNVIEAAVLAVVERGLPRR